MTYEEAKQIARKHTRGLVAKWEKTGLLDGLTSDVEKCKMTVLLPSEPKQYHYHDMTPEEREFSEAMYVISQHDKNEQCSKSFK